ncbi:DUF433 domain-containing protein [Niabella ginsenosidivorans]
MSGKPTIRGLRFPVGIY